MRVVKCDQCGTESYLGIEKDAFTPERWFRVFRVGGHDWSRFDDAELCSPKCVSDWAQKIGDVRDS